MNFRYRRATSDDASACAAILRQWIDETDWFPTTHPPSADVSFVSERITKGTVIVAEQGVECAGFMAIEDDFLSCLYVASRWRDQGIGRRLLAEAQAVQPKGFVLWTFQANLGAQRFYLRERLREVLRTDGHGNEENLPDIQFRWDGEK